MEDNEIFFLDMTEFEEVMDLPSDILDESVVIEGRIIPKNIPFLVEKD